jgi:hypothetical protein
MTWPTDAMIEAAGHRLAGLDGADWEHQRAMYAERAREALLCARNADPLYKAARRLLLYADHAQIEADSDVALIAARTVREHLGDAIDGRS